MRRLKRFTACAATVFAVILFCTHRVSVAQEFYPSPTSVDSPGADSSGPTDDMKRKGVYTPSPAGKVQAESAVSDVLESPLPGNTAIYSTEQDRRLGYHWKGLLVQSFEFNMVEDAFRLWQDNTLRDLVVTKPFWHDYISSLHQFNMHRWNDGDDFLVNYVGHPMQGAVTGFLEIQNSPEQSRIQWNEPGYWTSRTKAMLWSTIFSTNEEIGPLGEAGIGSEGGYTYSTHCDLHCNSPMAARGKSTNNTGWVDFIITPTVGTLWILAEDAIDKEVSERLVAHAGPNAIYPKIIRGALNPSRTMANLLRARKPWYRDWDHPDINSLDEGAGMHFQRLWEKGNGELQEYPDWRRVELAPHFTALATSRTTAGCEYCVGMTTGAGIQTSFQMWKYLYADGDLSYQPNASPLASDRAGGNLLAGFFGIRIGHHWPLYAVNLSIRPGFVQWKRAYLTSLPLSTPTHPAPPDPPTPQIGTITHFAWNAMISTDYKFNQHIAMRSSINQTLVRYRNACFDSSGVGIGRGLQWLNYDTPCQEHVGIGTPPYLTFLSHEDFVNRVSWGIQAGPVFSF